VIALLLRLTCLFGAAAAFALAEPSELPAEEIVKRSLVATYYAGKDERVQISMKLINSQGSTRDREMTMLRLNQPDGEQRYYIYFHSPSDVKGTAFMVWKHLGKEADRWIYIPAINLTRRIAADDKRSSFVGSDFAYEDVSGRQVNDENHLLLRNEEWNGRPAYVIESRPKASVDYSRRLSWIDSERWIPLKEEYYDSRGQLLRVFTADKVEQIGGHWTISSRTMKNMQTGHRTEVVFERTSYDVGIPNDLFSERYLRDAPRKWIQ
jgi:outer membrane lipoprotein-sorting protein